MATEMEEGGDLVQWAFKRLTDAHKKYHSDSDKGALERPLFSFGKNLSSSKAGAASVVAAPAQGTKKGIAGLIAGAEEAEAVAGSSSAERGPMPSAFGSMAFATDSSALTRKKKKGMRTDAVALHEHDVEDAPAAPEPSVATDEAIVPEEAVFDPESSKKMIKYYRECSDACHVHAQSRMLQESQERQLPVSARIELQKKREAAEGDEEEWSASRCMQMAEYYDKCADAYEQQLSEYQASHQQQQQPPQQQHQQ
eukprot:TRINITY_DN26976_c0_g1_i1.p1 TRINITY_DN26976_c0_g1~~TRINITY_DN26976_c0_g1_i1.p1  ORF type:complete len:254 (+),score=61.56 TRINITY_DN26976_c0_g1_i1:68-829(+)